MFRLAALFLAVWFGGSAEADTLIANFDEPHPLAEWSFYNGAEFPGATGSLTLGPGLTGKGAALRYAMCGGKPISCGNYVEAIWTAPAPLKADAEAGISLWVKTNLVTDLVLRIVDGTGQTLQYDSVATVTLEDPSGTTWHHVTLALQTKPSEYWGGANSGVFSGPLTQLGILAQPHFDGAKTPGRFSDGVIRFDDLSLVDALAAPISLIGRSLVSPAHDVPIAGLLGVNIHQNYTDKALTLANAAGFSFARDDLNWAGVETAAGHYDFSDPDSVMASLAAHHLGALWLFDYGNSLHGGYPTTASARAAFARFAAATARHYQTPAFAAIRVRYETWNEEDGIWNIPAADYGPLAKATAAAVHRVAPSLEVSTGGLANIFNTSTMDYLTTMIADGAATGAAAIGVHPYRTDAPEAMVQEASFMRGLKQPSGKLIPTLWDTEWGYPSYGFFSAAQYGDGHSAAARARQAVLAVRELMAAWLSGFPMAVWYDLIDDTGCDPGPDARNDECNFGLLDSGINPKPAYEAVKNFYEAAASRRVAGLLNGLPQDLHALQLDDHDGGNILVLWDDAIRMSHTVLLGDGVSRITDLYGKELAGAGTSQITISEGRGPVYVYH